VDVDAVLVGERRRRPFPRRDAAAAAAEEKFRGLDPRRAEPVQEIGLAGDFAVEEVCVAQFADVYLKACQTVWPKKPEFTGRGDERYLDSF
jgi:hypothetical protein